MEKIFPDTCTDEKNVRRLIHVQVKIMSDGSHVIHGILNVVNVVRHCLVMESFKEMSGSSPGIDLIFHLSSYVIHIHSHIQYFVFVSLEFHSSQILFPQ